MNSSRFRIHFLSIMVIFLWGLLPLTWFLPGHFILGVDLQVPVDAQPWIWQLSAWNPRWGTGYEWSVGFSNLFLSSVSAIFSLFTPDLLTVEKMFFVFWFLLPGLSCYGLACELYDEDKHWPKRILMTNFYMFNLYLQVLWGGNEAGLAAYAGLPLMLMLYLRGLKSRRYILYACIMGLSSWIVSASSMNLPILVVAFAGWTIFTGVYFIKEKSRLSPRLITETILFMGAALILMAGCNLFWMIPQGFVNQTKVDMPAFSTEAILTTKSWLAGISSDTSLVNVLRMQGDWTWYQGWYEPYRIYSVVYRNYPPMILLSWLIVGVILLGAFTAKHRWRAAFTLMAILGVILGMGVHPPFGVFYNWMVNHLPFFWVFRSPWFKFTLLTCLGYAFLFGEGVSFLADWVQKKTNSKRWTGIAVVLIALTANMVYAYPVTLGKMNPKPSERVKLKPFHIRYPEYVLETARWLNSQPGFFRVAFLPAHVNGVSVYEWGLASTSPAIYPFLSKPMLFEIPPSSSLDFGNRMQSVFRQDVYGPVTGQASEILRRMCARYLIQENDFEYDYFEGSPDYPLLGDTPDFIRNRLSRQQGIRFLRAIGRWDIYQMEREAAPHLGIATRAGLVFSDKGLELWPWLIASKLADPARTFLFMDGAEDDQEQKTALKINQAGLLDTLVFHGKAGLNRIPPFLDWKKNPLYRVHLLEFSEPLERLITPDSSVLNPHIKIRWADESSPQETDSSGVSWRWLNMSSGEKNHLELENVSDQPQKINLQWTVVSYKRDRDLFVYEGETLLKTFKTPAGKETTVALENKLLPPGKMILRFYTPYEADTRDGKRVTFSFREQGFLAGNWTYQGILAIPSDGEYQLEIFPLPIPEQLAPALACEINGKRILLNKNENAYIAQEPLTLTEGETPVRIDQIYPGGHYVFHLVKTGGAQSEQLPVPPACVILENSSTKAAASFTAKEPCLLIYRESYFPFWKAAAADGVELTDRFIADGFGNGYLIEKAGPHTVSIDYEVQRRFTTGWQWTGISALFCLIGILGCLFFKKKERAG